MKLFVIATFYHNYFEGRLMANGQIFSQTKMICAYNNAPLNSVLLVKDRQTGKIIKVRVTDRNTSNTLDLSKLAFKKLRPLKTGIIKNLEVKILK